MIKLTNGKRRFRDDKYFGDKLIYGYLEVRSVLKEGDRFVHVNNLQWKARLTTATDEDEKIAAGYIEAGKANMYFVFVHDSETYFNLPDEDH